MILSSCRDELMAADVVPTLVSCLEFSDITVQTSAAEALAAMATDTGVRGQFLSSGGVSLLLPLLLSPHGPLVTSALGLVRASAQSMEVAKEFCARGYVSPSHTGALLLSFSLITLALSSSLPPQSLPVTVLFKC